MDIGQIFLELHGFTQFIVVCLTYFLFKFVLWGLPNRILRTVKVCTKGWPPVHLDADGDWKPEPKSD